jgi:hypothetical protein
MVTGYSKHKKNKILIVKHFKGFQTDVFQNTGTSDTYSYFIAGKG